MYADEAYYSGNFGSSYIPAESLTQALIIASDVIDTLTQNRIVAIGFDNLTAFQQSTIKRACCMLAEDAYAGGLTPGVNLTGGFSLGDLSISPQTGVLSVCGVAVSGRGMSLLRQSGLTYPGVR